MLNKTEYYAGEHRNINTEEVMALTLVEKLVSYKFYISALTLWILLFHRVEN